MWRRQTSLGAAQYACGAYMAKSSKDEVPPRRSVRGAAHPVRAAAVTARDVRLAFNVCAEDFAEQLVAALDACGFAPYLDKQDVAPGEPWEQRLKGVNSTSRHSHFCHISRLDWIATLCVGSR